MSSNEYSQLGFSNKFMFGKLMENDERCKRLLEQILGFNLLSLSVLLTLFLVGSMFTPLRIGAWKYLT